MRRRLFASLALSLAVVACSGGGSQATAEPGELPGFTPESFNALLADSELPTVVNVWASWCLPCRSEAPLFTAAHQKYVGTVAFLGIDVQDTQDGAAGFIDEFGIPYDNLFDPNADVGSVLGGQGVPRTYFVAPGGALVDTHFGVIDEGQLALAIDDLIAQTGG